MLLRGGLLIEPWGSYKNYTSIPKNQSIISYNNNIYVCSVSHQSGATFEENSSKFATIGSANGGGTVELSDRYAGVWNLNTSGFVTLEEAVPDPTKSTGYLTISDDVFKYIGDDTPLAFEGGFYDYVVANGVSPVNSGIRSMKVNLVSNYLLYGIVNNNNTVADLLGLVFGGIPSSVSGILVFTTWLEGTMVYTVNNGVIDMLNFRGLEILGLTENEPIYLDLDTTTGSFSITVTGASDRLTLIDSEDNMTPIVGNTATFPAILDLANFTTDTFAPYFGVLFELATDSYPAQNLTFDLGTTELGRLPFLSTVFNITAPQDATDGQIYKVVGNDGTYLDNPNLYEGDYVEFSENLQKLIITRPAQTNAEISNIALTRVVEELEQGGIIYDAINEFNTQTIAAVNGFNNVILANSNYVELSNGGITNNSFVAIPINVSGNNLKVGQRLYIMSKFTSSFVSLTTLLPANQIGPQVVGVTAGVTYEYVIVRIVSNKAVWLRVK